MSSLQEANGINVGGGTQEKSLLNFGHQAMRERWSGLRFYVQRRAPGHMDPAALYLFNKYF